MSALPITRTDEVTEWADELWSRAIDCDSESGPALLANALRRAAETGSPAARNAPDWIHAVTPAEIVRQRSLKWPDFHPEDFCHQCGRRNPCWFADTAVWQTATGSTGDGGGVYCPTCFAALWETKTGKTAILWRLSIDPRSRDASVPDRGNRDQLTEALARKLFGFRYHLTEPGLTEHWDLCETKDYIRAEAAQFIAAEVEARVQAAANQRAAEELRSAADVIDLGPRFLGDTTPAQVNRNRANFLAAALASPAPAPQTGEGRR